MKRKICITFFTLSGGLMLVFAAGPDKCTEKFDACKTTCTNEWYQCKSKGNDIENCNSRRKQCESECTKDLNKCQGNTAPAAKPSPAKPKPKK